MKFSSISINKLNGLRTSVSFRSWGVWNVFNRNILTRFTWNRVYRFARLSVFRMVTRNIWDLTRSSFTRVIRVSWELWLWCIWNWLAIRTDRNNVAIWSVGHSNCGIRIVLSYSSATSCCFSCSVTLNNRRVDLAKCVVSS